MYAKLENNKLTYSPNPIEKDGKRIYNPPADVLTELGYKPVINTDYPQDEKHYKQGYEETETAILIVWVDNEREYWQSVPYDDAVSAKIRERYTLDQELAISRQRDTKPEEFEAFFAYCEECKVFVKAKKAEYA